MDMLGKGLQYDVYHMYDHPVNRHLILMENYRRTFEVDVFPKPALFETIMAARVFISMRWEMLWNEEGRLEALS